VVSDDVVSDDVVSDDVVSDDVISDVAVEPGSDSDQLKCVRMHGIAYHCAVYLDHFKQWQQQQQRTLTAGSTLPESTLTGTLQQLQQWKERYEPGSANRGVVKLAHLQLRESIDVDGVNVATTTARQTEKTLQHWTERVQQVSEDAYAQLRQVVQ
jgi:hypothetical protein